MTASPKEASTAVKTPAGSSSERPSSKGPSVRRISDKLATGLITVGGAGVIVVVVAIFVFIAFETIPLWIPPSFEETSTARLADTLGPLLVAGEDEYRRVGYGVTEQGYVVAFNLSSGEIFSTHIPEDSRRGRVTAAYYHEQYALLSWGDENGSLFATRVEIASGGEGSNTIPEIIYKDLWSVVIEGKPTISKIVGKFSRSSELVLSAIENRGNRQGIRYYLVREQENRLTGEVTREVTQTLLDAPDAEPILSLALDSEGRKVVAGTASASLQYWDVRDIESPTLIQAISLPGKSPASALEFLLGDQSILVGCENGAVESYTWINDSLSISGSKLISLNSFDFHSSSVTSISSSARNKTFLTSSDNGEIFLHYQTTAKTLLKKKTGGPVRHVSFAPKSNGSLVILSDGRIVSYAIDNPHPEVSWGVLLGKVQYEGYAEPTYTWQSSSGTDDFEPKLSLIPLLVGTLKGAFYALIFALPIALFAAIYTALFAHPKIKNIVKPTVEIMAALPSVVIGFIAALWLAPMLEKSIVDVAFMVITIPIFVILAALVWQAIPRRFTNRLPQGSEVFLIIPTLLVMAYVGFKTGPLVEQALFAGNFKQWLYETLQVTYDQRNSIVVGFAMGFAVIPIIFTISEDALSSVPEHLTAGSLALGATRWQTAIKVVLPTASPGIFSAAMVGFGRAVGETMIVLMATGNTPLMNFSPFLGMRTLSANIAVEIPEAPYLGTLYRVLFVSGILLFCFTFVVNTVAEIIRQRLRKSYSTI